MTPSYCNIARFPRNTRGRDLIGGDVHGCISKLCTALDSIGFNPEAGDRLFLPGDLVDRGPESHMALGLLGMPGVFSTIGNHEIACCLALDGAISTEFHVRTYSSSWFYRLSREQQAMMVSAFSTMMPLAFEIETDGGLVGVIHADCPFPTWEHLRHHVASRGVDQMVLGACLEDRVRWETGNRAGIPDLRALVVGHTPIAEGLQLGNVIFNDRHAWHQGGLSNQPFVFIDAATLQPVRPAAVALPW